MYFLSSQICVGSTFKHPFFSARFSLYCPLVFTLYTTRFNNKNFTFCLQNVFILFVFISKQTAIISIYIIDWLVFKTETESVYCAVRSECYIYFRFFSVLKESENALCFKETRIQSGGSPYEICDHLRDIVRGYSPSILVFPVSIILPVSDLSSS